MGKGVYINLIICCSKIFHITNLTSDFFGIIRDIHSSKYMRDRNKKYICGPTN